MYREWVWVARAGPEVHLQLIGSPRLLGIMAERSMGGRERKRTFYRTCQHCFEGPVLMVHYGNTYGEGPSDEEVCKTP